MLAFPAALALAVATTRPPTTTKRFWIAVAILTLSAWVGVNGMVFEQNSMDICWEGNYQLEFLCWYVPEYSALWRPFVTHDLGQLLAAIWNSDQRAFAMWEIITWGYLVLDLSRQQLARRMTRLA